MKTLENLFLEELADIYNAEKQLVRALPKMAKFATDSNLAEAMQAHLEETRGHVTKLEQVFEEFGKAARGKECEAMAGLLKEGEDMAKENEDSPAINAALIAAAQKVEHYEIATYGTLREWAQQLEMEDAADLLEEILDEEKATDSKLSELAQERINEAAEGEGEDDEEETEKASTARKSRK